MIYDNFNEFDIINLEYFLPDNFKGLSKEYFLKCIFDEKIQKNWIPNVGDIIVGKTGNIFVISSKTTLVPDLGGDLYFFGGSLSSNDGGGLCNSTTCYLMNKEGVNFRNITYHMSKFSDFRYVPYPHEINNKY